MKNEQGEKLDEFFRDSLADPQIPFDEENWLVMQRKLEKNSKRRYFFMGTAIGSAAAVFLLTLAWLFTRLEPVPATKQFVNQKPPSIKSIIPANKQEVLTKADNSTASPIETKAFVKSNRKVNSSEFTAKRSEISETSVPVISADEPLLIVLDKTNLNKLGTLAFAGNPNQESDEPETRIPYFQSIKADTLRSSVALKKVKFRPPILLGFSAAQDVNGVNSFKDAENGLNGGITASITLSPKLSITSGIFWAKKLYETDFRNYKPNSTYKFPVDPLYVDADCRVLDIPLNVNYLFFDQYKNRMSVSLGASSYIMQSEDYIYRYFSPTARGPRQYHLKDQNKHWMGIANIGFSFERKLNNSTGIALNPYLKVPLTQIGYGNVKLLSAGVALNMNINLSELVRKKP